MAGPGAAESVNAATAGVEPEVEAGAWVQNFACGIDLGTSNSCCYTMTGDELRMSPLDINNEKVQPSVVTFMNDGKIHAGHRATIAAKKKRNVAATVRVAKYLMGKASSDISMDMRTTYENMCGCKIAWEFAQPRFIVETSAGKKDFRPEQIGNYVALIFYEALRKKFFVPLGKQIECVVTCPARFGQAEREATKAAMEIANFKVQRVLTEPTAACVMARHEKVVKVTTNENETIKHCVIDLGGGTFDVSYVHDEGSEVLSVENTDGNTRLGGSDFTHAIAQQLCSHFCDQNKLGFEKIWGDKENREQFLEAAENAKLDVNNSGVSRDEARSSVDLCISDIDFTFDYTPAHFTKAFVNYRKEIKSTVERLCSEGNVNIRDFNYVIMVGGSSRIFELQDMLIEMGVDRNRINTHLNPDECVAQGACVLSNSIGQFCQVENPLLLLDTLPSAYRIRTDEDTATVMLPRNTRIPSSKTETFTTSVDFQEQVTIVTTEGDRILSSQNKPCGQFNLAVQRAKRRVPQIEVTFSADSNGIVSVTAKDLATGAKQEVTCKSQSMTAEERAQFAEEQATHREEDERVANLYKLKSQCMDFVYDVESALADAKDNPHYEAASKLVADAKRELNQLNSENIKFSNEDFFKQKLESLKNNESCQEIMKAAGQPADAAGGMPGGMPTGMPNMNAQVPAAASEPNVEEAD